MALYDQAVEAVPITSDFEGPSVATVYPVTPARLRNVLRTMEAMKFSPERELMLIITHEMLTFKARTR